MVSGGQVGVSARLSRCPPHSAGRPLSLQRWPWGLPQGPAQFTMSPTLQALSPPVSISPGRAWPGVGLGALGSSLAFARPAREACL